MRSCLCDPTFSRLIELRLVTDGLTDRQTDTRPWLVPRDAMHRAVKIGRVTAVYADFTLRGNVLPAVTHCRDLGVAIVSDLWSTQYIPLVSKAYQRANCILR